MSRFEMNLYLATITLAIGFLFYSYWNHKGLEGPDEEQEQAMVYCQRVHDGIWPDFHRNYAQFCTKDGKWNGK
jgi:hypothetical protein